MKKTKLRRDIASEAWDLFVKDNGGTCYHTNAWIDNVSQFYKAKDLSFAWMDGEEIKAVYTLYEVVSLRGKRLTTSLFSSYGGLLSKTEDDLEAISVFKEKYPDTLLKVIVSAADEAERPVAIVDEYRVIIKLSEYETFDCFLSRYKSKERNKFRKALKSGLSLSSGSDEKLLNDFYKLQLLTRRKQGLPTPSIRYYRSIFQNCESIKPRVDVVYYENIPVASCLSLNYQGTLYYASSNFDADYSSYRPIDYLMLSLIEREINDGTEVFDFGGTPLFHKQLLDFKLRWGTDLDFIGFVNNGASNETHGVQSYQPLLNSLKADDAPSIDRRVGLTEKLMTALFQRVPIAIAAKIGGLFIQIFK